MPSRSDPDRAFERLRRQAEELLRYRSDVTLEPMGLLELIKEGTTLILDVPKGS
jgi:hypothetical protein